MGNDIIYDGGHDFIRPADGKRKCLCGSFQSLQKYDEAAAFSKYLGGDSKSADDFKEEMSTPWMCFEMEQCGAFVGLSLPRIEI